MTWLAEALIWSFISASLVNGPSSSTMLGGRTRCTIVYIFALLMTANIADHIFRNKKGDFSVYPGRRLKAAIIYNRSSSFINKKTLLRKGEMLLLIAHWWDSAVLSSASIAISILSKYPARGLLAHILNPFISSSKTFSLPNRYVSN